MAAIIQDALSLPLLLQPRKNVTSRRVASIIFERGKSVLFCVPPAPRVFSSEPSTPMPVIALPCQGASKKRSEDGRPGECWPVMWYRFIIFLGR